MKIYHTETQADYDALMVELEEQGYKWISGDEPSQVNAWKVYKNQIGILMDNSTITHSSLDYLRSKHPDTPITKYKSKADEKMKFTKENVGAVIYSYFETFIGACPDRLMADIYEMYESDTITEQRYTVVIADRYLVQLFIGRTDYRFVEFDELCAWKPNAFQLTEAEIKAIDERYWTFAAPAKEVAE